MFTIMASYNYMLSADEVAQDRSFTLLYILEQHFRKHYGKIKRRKIGIDRGNELERV